MIEYFTLRNVFVNLLTLLLIGVGIFTAITMNREAFPNVDFDIVVVTVVYPGASPQEVEKLVTNPLEESIKEVNGIEEYRSSSIESRSGITIKIDPDVEDTAKVINDIRSAVERAEDLPEEAKKPLVIEMTSANTPVLEIALSSKIKKDGNPALTYAELRKKAEILEKKILNMDSIARIHKSGWRDAEIHVNVDPAKLEANYISLDQIAQALKSRNLNLPGGEIKGENRDIVIRTIGEYSNITEIENTFIRSNDLGRGIRIKDVAAVKEDFVEEDIIQKTRGTPSISLTAIKRESADVIQTVDDLKIISEEFAKNYESTVTVNIVNDVSFFVKRRLGVLMSNGATGLILVVASIFFFLGWRTSLMVALGIPVAMGTTFIILNFMGVTLNLISMFGLIIVVGILVDDAIIVSENFYRHMEEGLSTYDAAVKGTQEVASPIIATVTTTIAAFAPLMFMSGIMGKFIWLIPLVVIIALVSSLFESFFILPSHLHDVNKYAKEHPSEIKGESGWFKNFREKMYLPSLEYAVHHKRIVFGALILVFISAGVVQKLFGRFVLFPDVVETFQIKFTAPSTASLDYTHRFVKEIEREVAGLSPEELDVYTSYVGLIRKNANDPFTKRGNNFGQIMVYLTPEQSRERSAHEIIEQIRSKTEWMVNEEFLKKNKDRKITSKDNTPHPEDLKRKLISLEFEKLQGGPPVGKQVAIEITGENFKVLEEIADRYKTLMQKVPGIVDIDDDFEEGKDELRLIINERIASQTGVNTAQIAMAVNASIYGNVATSIKRPNEEVDIRVRFAEKHRRTLQGLKQIRVLNMTRNLVPIDKLISFEESKGVMAINHLNGNRLITATANVREGVLTSREANLKVAELGKDLPKKYPGYEIHFGGENKDTEESMQSLGKAFIVALLIIFMILASLFKSVMQPIVVLGAIPFSLIGVIFAFFFHGMPFSFLSMMGVIGLSGVVVNDSIVLVDFANKIRDENPGMPVQQVAIQAGSMRLRAVMLTTITTVLGLLPTAYGIGGHDPFLVPMAMSFAWGLMFSTLLTLIIVPILYVANENAKNWVKSKLNLVES